MVTRPDRTARRVHPMPINVYNAGREIKQRRLEAGLTQQEFANLASISSKELARIETGANEKVSFVTLCHIALSLDIPIQDIAEWFGIKGLRSFSRKVGDNGTTEE